MEHPPCWLQTAALLAQILTGIAVVVITVFAVCTNRQAVKVGKRALKVAKQSLVVNAWAGIVVGPTTEPYEASRQLASLKLTNPGPSWARLHGLYSENKRIDDLENRMLYPRTQLEAPFVGLRDLLKKKKGEKEIQCRFRFSDSLKRKWDQHYKIKLPNFDFVPLDCVRVIEEH